MLMCSPLLPLPALPPGTNYMADPGDVVPLHKQLGFLHLLSHLLTTLGMKLEPFLLGVLLHILTSSVQLLDQRHLVTLVVCVGSNPGVDVLVCSVKYCLYDLPLPPTKYGLCLNSCILSSRNASAYLFSPSHSINAMRAPDHS